MIKIFTAALASVLVLSLITSNGFSGENFLANASYGQDEKPQKFNSGQDYNSKKINMCPSQSFLVGPEVKGADKILDITYTALNDEDSGVGSTYWALDHFKEHLIVWQLPDSTYYALKTYDGIFVAPTGGPNPGDGTKTQLESTFGNITGGYVATFTATTFNPRSLPTSGNIGTFNYGGTMKDIIFKTYAGSPNPYDWTSAYFIGLDSFDQTHWGWSYNLNSDLQSSTSVNQWCNYSGVDGGNSGDILS